MEQEMRRLLFLSIAELLLIYLGFAAWIFKPEAIAAVAVGFGVAIGISTYYLLRDIERAHFILTHEKEIKEQLAKYISSQTGQKVKPEDIEEVEEK
jgi:hypothetical protein